MVTSEELQKVIEKIGAPMEDINTALSHLMHYLRQGSIVGARNNLCIIETAAQEIRNTLANY